MEDESHLWLITFSDVLLLLLAFFVLRFSMSSLEWHNWKSHSPLQTIPLLNEIFTDTGKTLEYSKFNEQSTQLHRSVLMVTEAEEEGELSFQTITSLQKIISPVVKQSSSSLNKGILVEVYTEKSDPLMLTSAVLRQIIDAGVDPQTISAMMYDNIFSTNNNQNASSRHHNPRIEVSISTN